MLLTYARQGRSHGSSVREARVVLGEERRSPSRCAGASECPPPTTDRTTRARSTGARCTREHVAEAAFRPVSARATERRRSGGASSASGGRCRGTWACVTRLSLEAVAGRPVEAWGLGASGRPCAPQLRPSGALRLPASWQESAEVLGNPWQPDPRPCGAGRVHLPPPGKTPRLTCARLGAREGT